MQSADGPVLDGTNEGSTGRSLTPQPSTIRIRV